MAGIIAKGIHKSFFDQEKEKSLNVLDNIDLRINNSEFVCILGPSGCGKSTFLYIVAGLEKADQGEISFFDLSPSKESPVTNLVFQEYALFPWMRVLENIGYGLKVRGFVKKERTEIAKKYLQMVGLIGFEHKFPYQLSGGMKQRVAIARVLANNPQIMLMDEPFASLDANSRMILQMELLRIWESEKKTVVFVTHNIDEAILLGDRVILFSGRPAKIKEDFIVDLDRPRNMDMRTSRIFVDLYARLWHSLKSEINWYERQD